MKLKHISPIDVCFVGLFFLIFVLFVFWLILDPIGLLMTMGLLSLIFSFAALPIIIATIWNKSVDWKNDED